MLRGSWHARGHTAQPEPRPPAAKATAPQTYRCLGSVLSITSAARFGGREHLAQVFPKSVLPHCGQERLEKAIPYHGGFQEPGLPPSVPPPPLSSLAGGGSGDESEEELSHKQAGLTASTFPEARDLPQAPGDCA